jgi:hypothetical protein
VGIAGFLTGGGRIFLKTKGLKIGRRLTGMLGLGACGFFVTGRLFFQSKYYSSLPDWWKFSFAFGVMVSYAVCTDIGRNNAGTVTGAMNFSGQLGALFSR